MRTIDKKAYSEMYGPTVGDKVRLGDTELLIEVEKDLTTYGEEVKFGVLDIKLEKCVYSKPTNTPESVAFIKISDDTKKKLTLDNIIIFKGWIFASSPALNALENSVYDISILACKKVDKQLEKSSSVLPKERISTSN